MEVNTSLSISEKVYYPSDKEPSYDLVVKLHGPNGSNLRNIAAYTKTKILILGKGSIPDRNKEEELRSRDEPEYKHFKEPLHVLIQSDGSKYAAEFGVSAAVDAINMHMFEYIKNVNNSDNASSSEVQNKKHFDFNDYPNEKISVSEKILLPVKGSSYNIVAALLGPKGHNIRNIGRSTKTRISILGKGSMRDETTEEEYFKSGDPDYAHLNEPLHALIETSGQREIVQARVDAAVKEISSYMEGEVIMENEWENTRYLSAHQSFDDDEAAKSVEKNPESNFINISEKIYYPSGQEPSHSFMTDLIGKHEINPISKLRSITDKTGTKITVGGKGSTKDRSKEEELRKSQDPQYQHLNEPLHVLIQVVGSKDEANSRLKAAVNEIKMHMDEDVKLANFDYQNEKVFLNEKIFFPDERNSSSIISRLLGSNGSNLRSIATDTKARISILGKGSMRNRHKEDEFIKSGDPEYSYLNEPLHVLIQTAGPRHIAQSRLDAAMTEIKKYVLSEHRNFEYEFERAGSKESSFDNDEHVTLCEKVLIPVEKYPLCNFIGRLLGPKGSNLKSIGASSRAWISILGKGSTKDTGKVQLGDNEEPLHVLIQVVGSKDASRERLDAAVLEINKCIDYEINRVSPSASSQTRQPFDNEEFVSLTEKVYFPVDKYPTYNFAGKLLGPKGSNLKRIAASSQSPTTKTKISILGKGSAKEPLHVLVNVSGPRYEAQSSLLSVLDEIKKYTVPENIEIHNAQLNKVIPQETPFIRPTGTSSSIMSSYYGDVSNTNVPSGKCYYYMPGDKRPHTSYS